MKLITRFIVPVQLDTKILYKKKKETLKCFYMLMDTTNASSAEKERSNNAGTIQTVYLAANGQKNDINLPLVILATRTEISQTLRKFEPNEGEQFQTASLFVHSG